MREILFRGQTRRFGEKVKNFAGDPMPSNWVYGGVCCGEGAFSIIYVYMDEEKEMPIEKHVVYTDTIGQYTGLTDKNGKKIFEGDILKVKHGIIGREEEKPKMPRNAYGLHYKENETGMFGRWFYYRNYAVEYKAHGNSRGKYIVRNGSDQCDFTNSLFYNHDAEILGNIHDNPELLKGGE